MPHNRLILMQLALWTVVIMICIYCKNSKRILGFGGIPTICSCSISIDKKNLPFSSHDLKEIKTNNKLNLKRGMRPKNV
jgi:hypothetical protein